jgi:DNA-directed RNA polymerase subunit RPC12/RpoP
MEKMNMQSQIIPPMPGMMAQYVCLGCGKRFSAKVSLFEAPGVLFGKKCPRCGGRHVMRDWMVCY